MKQKIKFICNKCGYESLKWLGKCPSCSQWNTFEEEMEIPVSKYDTINDNQIHKSVPQKLSEISENEGERIITGTKELDRVLGGGIVKGSMVLVGGDPGIGKSTLLLQICKYLGEKNDILYVTGSADDPALHPLHVRRKSYFATGQPFCFPARSLHHNLRCNQGICPQLQPCHESRIKKQGHSHDGHESRLGQNGIL